MLRLARHRLVRPAPLARRLFRRLRSLNIVVTVSSFNAKRSDLNCLHRFGISFLGVSRDFITVVNTSTLSQRVLSDVVRLSTGLSLKVITRNMRARRRDSCLAGRRISFLRNCLFNQPVPNTSFVGTLDSRWHTKRLDGSRTG